MSIVELIMLLVAKFVPMTEQNYNKLKYDIEKDWSAVITDEKHEGYKANLKTRVKKMTEGPWAQLTCAVAYIPLVKMIQDWMNPAPEQTEP